MSQTKLNKELFVAMESNMEHCMTIGDTNVNAVNTEKASNSCETVCLNYMEEFTQWKDKNCYEGMNGWLLKKANQSPYCSGYNIKELIQLFLNPADKK